MKADIVEALQGLKCMIRRDILFREHPNIRSELTTDDDEVLDDKMKSDTEKGL